MSVGVPSGTRAVRVEQISRASFAPFGQLLMMGEAERLPRRTYDGTIESYHAGHLEADVPVEFIVARLNVRDFVVHYMERHFQITQAFVPLGGSPVIVVVARPDARLEHEVPAVDEIRAFMVPGNIGVNLHRCTWHEPPFPLVDGTLVLLTNHKRLMQELGAELDARGEIHKSDVDKRNVAERTGFAVRLALP
jgi:ureidoglycolate lyase